MAATTPQTFTMMMDFAQGPFIADSEVPSGYNTPPAKLVASNPYEFIFDLYELYDETSAVKMGFTNTPSSDVGKVYVTLAESGIARTRLTTGCTVTLESTGDPAVYNRVRVVIANDVLPTSFACGTNTRFIFEMETAAGAELATWFMDTLLVDAAGTSDGSLAPTVTTADESVGIETVSTTSTLTGTPGPRVILVDASAADVTITLPASDAYAPGQDITFIAVNVTHTITIQTAEAEAFGGTAATSFTITAANNAQRVVAYYDTVGGTHRWYHLNWVEVVR